jgi:hypothetical protein
MVAALDTFSDWLTEAQIPERRLTPEQQVLLQAAYRFRHTQGTDYYSTRLLSHFLLHCDCGLNVAQIARLLRLSRPTASRQQGLSSKQALQQAHHRMDGRPYGKLLPRYAGPIAQFLLTRPDATRADLIDFVDQTFHVRVSRIALYKFLKKYGLEAVANDSAAPLPPPRLPASPPQAPPQPPANATPAERAPPFCSDTPTTPAPS